MQELSCVDSYGLSLQLAFLYVPVGTSKRAQIKSCALGPRFLQNLIINLIT